MESTLVSPRDVISSGLCIGCGVCLAGTGHDRAFMRWDAYGELKPGGPAGWLDKRSDEFSRLCPFSPAARDEDRLARELYPQALHHDDHIGVFDAAFVGYAAEEGFRANGSSGGMVSWTAAELMRAGLVDGVVHVVEGKARDGANAFFHYAVSRSPAQVRAGAKSRYYPVELSDAIRTMRAMPGRYAVVGIPCFIKALRLLCAQDAALRARVAFTLGLFCGHMKSARLVESFAWQMGRRVEETTGVEYRRKDAKSPANWYVAALDFADGSSAAANWWNLADGDWGAGFFQNSACNYCDDVVAETADISFGDAWIEPFTSDGRGTNVVIIRSPQLHGLVKEAIEQGRLMLEPVDADFIRRTQAAGLRHRREGLAFRLSLPRRGLLPVKRVGVLRRDLPWRRKATYRMRRLISRWSHRMFWLARRLDRPGIYIHWARMALASYHALAYSRGKAGRLFDRLCGSETRRR